MLVFGAACLLSAPSLAPAKFSRATAAVMSSARADAQAALFDMLLRQAEGRPPRVTLQGGRGESGRGLFSTADLDAGEEILRVPSELCLTAHRSGARVQLWLAGHTAHSAVPLTSFVTT